MKHKNFFVIHFVFLILILLLTLLNYIVINDLFKSKGLRIVIVVLLELGVIYLIFTKLAKSSKRVLFYLGLFLYIFYSFIVIFQCFSIYLSNNFISPLAISNAKNNNLINATLLYIVIAFNLLIIALCIYLNFKSAKHEIAGQVSVITYKRKNSPFICLVILYLIFLIGIDDFKESSIAKNQAPFSALVQAFYGYIKNDFLIDKFLGNQKEYKKIFSKYTVFTSLHPFEKNNSIMQPNVIIFFMEGVSAQLLSKYNDEFPNLTPNIDKLINTSLQVTNYYNHTAATNRGIRGNLISGYQLIDNFYDEVITNKSMQRPTIFTILNKHDYQTEFFIPHAYNRTNMPAMLQSLDVKKIYYLENIADELLNKNVKLTITGDLSDKSLITGVINNLKQKENTSNQPSFFIGVYNVETHAFFDNKKHPYKSGNNEVLNRVHNFDYQFKKFLTYFLDSPFSKNTLLIVTSDHATFPDPAYRKISKAEFFVDKIPLIIYSPFIKLPKTYDAKGRNSLDFAPTVLHLLNIQHEQNMFLGCSLFEECKKENFNVSTLGNGFFITDNNRLYEEKKIPDAYKKAFIQLKQKVYMYYSLDYK